MITIDKTPLVTTVKTPRSNGSTLPAARAPEYDVVVVGLGPVGAVAAHLLAREGLNVLAVEPSLEPYDKPRAIGIDHEALRVLQKVGITDELSLFMGPYRASEYRSATGEVLRRIVPQPEPHPLSWPPYNTFIQPELERLLRSGLAHWPNLDTAVGWRCQSVDQDDAQAKLVLQDVNGDAERTVTSQYVIGCDGAWSTIREAMGLKLEDLAFDEPWLVVDILVNDKAALPNATVQFCDPARPCTFVHGPADLRRWEIMLLPGEEPMEMLKNDVIWSMLERWLTPEQGRIWRAAAYRFHALVCSEWRRGRFFVAGDAAHQTPPFMAQGLNQGIRDVANLCWKIGEMLRHGAHPALLDTYDEERRPNARAVIELTKNLGKLICERDPIAAAERDRRMLEEMHAGKGEIVRQDLLPPLTGGFLLVDEKGGYAPGTGSVFPQPWVKTEAGLRRMDDAIGARFLMVVQPDWAPTAADCSLAERLGVTLASVGGRPARDGVIGILEEAGLIETWMCRNGLAAVLVRPDHIVFGGANGADGEAALLHALERAVRNLDVAGLAAARM